ncbi:MAG: hypothetical protein M3299_00055 [Thermoproteota archaeon]|nr:hypothetical protein [Thermoproteota archaeon]
MDLNRVIHDNALSKKYRTIRTTLVTATLAVMLGLSTITITGGGYYPANSAFAIEQDAIQLSQEPGLLTINRGNEPDVGNFQLPDGYTIHPLLWNLSLPTSVTFDTEGNMYIAEAGFAYGGLKPMPKIIKIANDGTMSILTDRGLNGPVNDIEYHEGKLYVSHRGIISTIDLATQLKEDIIVGLPSTGDHHNNEIEFGPDGRLYWGQGTATNSGVVGIDNYHFGWLQVAPDFHDRPGMNVTLTGNASSTTRNPLTPEPNDTATTGAFVAFGNSTVQGQVIKGETKCNGCIISANPDGSNLQIEAWGLRNPYGLAFSQNGTLLVTMNGADERGSRPIANDTDKIYTIDVSQSPNFYGWPDFYGNGEPVTEEKFQSVRGNQSLQLLMQNPPEVVKPLAEVQVAAALTQVDFSNSSQFGHEGMAFAAEFGSMIPATHAPQEVTEPTGQIGHKVIMVDPQTGNYSDFLSLRHHSNLFRPVGVVFNEQEGALYLVSIGKMEVRMTLPNGTPLPNPMPWPYDNTGIVWKIVKPGGGNNATVATTGTEQQQQQPSANQTQQQQQNMTGTNGNNNTGIVGRITQPFEQLFGG